MCGGKAVFSAPALCEEHFCEHVELVVRETVERYGLFTRDDRVCVAASGGKDSSVALHVLQALGYRVEALAVDEGIAGYRESTLACLRSLCDERGIPLRVVSFAEEVGAPLDDLVKGRRPCSVCGVFRRSLLNKHAKGCDVLVTGHNLDDESQSVLMNLVKASGGRLRRGYLRSPSAEGFVPRVKPLARLSEREVLAYAFLQGLPSSSGVCPYARSSLRFRVRDVLDEYEAARPGMKRSLADAALRVSAPVASSFSACPVCGGPAAGGVCRACSLREELLGDAP